MASVESISTISKVFSKLGDNTGSVVPMFAKDITSSGLTSYTYFKDGGKMDGAEKAIEEFGTTVIWLGGIPLIKKIFNKTAYKKAGLNPDIDAKRLFTKGGKTVASSLEYAKEKATSLGSDFSEQANILAKTVNNKVGAKNLAVSKFVLSTAAIGLALYGLITFKQKRTEKKVEEQIIEKQIKKDALENALHKDTVYKQFKGLAGEKSLSFKGLNSVASLFMTNPVANTALVDGVIVTTRLKQARKGEKLEVGLREACQLAFIYGLAKPLQTGLEFVGKKILKKPIGLNYAALDSEILKQAIVEEKTQKGSSKLLKQAKEIINLAGENEKNAAMKLTKESVSNKTAKKMIDFIFNKENSDIGEILKRNGAIGTFKTKEGVEQLSLLSNISPDKVRKTCEHTVEIIESATEKANLAKYLKQTKFIKGAAIAANILISAVLMGYVQPKLNLAMRKKLNNGDNTNPAIKNIENEVHKKLLFEGKVKA